MDPMVGAVLVAETVLGGELVVGQQPGHFGEHPFAIVGIQVIEPPGWAERLVDPVAGDAGDVLAHPAGREGRAGDGVCVDDRGAGSQHLPEAGLGLAERHLGPSAPGQLAADQRARDERERHGDQGAAPSREPGEASLRLEGRRALGEEPSLLVLHLPDQPVNQLHQLFAPAADHGASRCGWPAGAPRLDRPAEPLEAHGDERGERIESLQLRLVVGGQGAEPRQEPAEARQGGIVRREVGRVPGDDVAAHRRLSVDQIGEGGLELPAHFQGVRHPARTLDGGRRAPQRRRAHREDDDDGDREPDLDLALEAHVPPGRRSSCGSTYFV